MNTSTRYEPFREMVPLFQAMDRLFDNSFVRPASMLADASVPVDVEETDSAYVLTASLPGWRPEDVNVTFQNGTVTIEGQHREENGDKERVYHLRERRISSFRRTISFPQMVDADRADASYEHGILTLTLPKAESAKPRRIQIGGNGRKQLSSSK